MTLRSYRVGTKHIHAKGENVEDVLRDAQGAENEQIIQEDGQEVDHMEADVDEPAIDSVAASAEAQHIPQTDVSQVCGFSCT
ncbi:unnamed protein product [Aspergillus oryzae]|uniref:Unnamed protein product n=1 Tax=Aspergillus oryzae TaxID=5062 RepID=A0AAN5BWF5_ASPOZ|nr:unnamed protein product [Aspergillus oryzae]GMG10965.1 unnamed protein product [Aspergillus oryzae]GMG36236.1 unnamed protein product [Aspergillus oryzae]